VETNPYTSISQSEPSQTIGISDAISVWTTFAFAPHVLPHHRLHHYTAKAPKDGSYNLSIRTTRDKKSIFASTGIALDDLPCPFGT
tara:strand:- start:348 stop:605 length:258 start_codon:yes stop_codon:yes gene_type:complete